MVVGAEEGCLLVLLLVAGSHLGFSEVLKWAGFAGAAMEAGFFLGFVQIGKQPDVLLVEILRISLLAEKISVLTTTGDI